MTMVCSCAKEIVLDPQEEPLVVVECVLTEEPVQTLRLGLTKGASMAEAPVITEAEAVLFDLTMKTEVGRFERKDDGIWTLDYQAMHYHSYRLEVHIGGYDMVWAELTMPESCKVRTQEMHLYSVEYNNFEEWMWVLSNNSYVAGKTAVYSVGSIQYYIQPNHPTWIRAFNYNPETGEREMAGQICTDAPYVDDFNLCGTYAAPVAAVNLRRYDYTDWRNPVLDERLFEASLCGHLDDLPIHNRYLRMKTESDDRKEVEELAEIPISISGNFTGNYYEGAPVDLMSEADCPVKDDEGYILATSVTEDYDRYLRDAIMFKQLEESTDLSSIYYRDNVHSNINGGLGIFGAKTEKILGWKPAYILSVDSDGYPIVYSQP